MHQHKINVKIFTRPRKFIEEVEAAVKKYMGRRWPDYPKMLSRNHSKNSSGRSIGILSHIMPPRAKTPSMAGDLGESVFRRFQKISVLNPYEPADECIYIVVQRVQLCIMYYGQIYSSATLRLHLFSTFHKYDKSASDSATSS